MTTPPQTPDTPQAPQTLLAELEALIEREQDKFPRGFEHNAAEAVRAGYALGATTREGAAILTDEYIALEYQVSKEQGLLREAKALLVLGIDDNHEGGWWRADTNRARQLVKRITAALGDENV